MYTNSWQGLKCVHVSVPIGLSNKSINERYYVYVGSSDEAVQEADVNIAIKS